MGAHALDTKMIKRLHVSDIIRTRFCLAATCEVVDVRGQEIWSGDVRPEGI